MAQKSIADSNFYCQASISTILFVPLTVEPTVKNQKRWTGLVEGFELLTVTSTVSDTEKSKKLKKNDQIN